MSYKVLSLKWRPQRFEDVIGQNHVTQTLINAINLDKVAQAYLFTGPRGVGKTTTARILAMAINSPSSSIEKFDPNSIESREIATGISMDVIEIDGASNRGIEEIRNLREQIKFSPMNSKFKIIIIDEVHMLTTQAFNALLTTLEEPPEHGKFIFATTDIHKVPSTIISRCQRFDFNRISISDITTKLHNILKAEGIKMSTESIFLIAKKADGSMRDALSLLDQVIAYCGESFEHEKIISALGVIQSELYFEFTDAILGKDYQKMAGLIKTLSKTGVQPTEIVLGIIEHFKNILYSGIQHADLLTELNKDDRSRYLEENKNWDRRDIFYVNQMLMDSLMNIKQSDAPFLVLEMIFFKILEMENSVQLSDLIDKIEGSITNNEKSPSNKKTTLVLETKKELKKQYQKETSNANNPEVVNNNNNNVLTNKSKNSKISLESLRESWSLMIGNIQNSRPSISAMLEDYQPGNFIDNHLEIMPKTKQSYNEKILKNGLDVLQNEILNMFNVRITLEVKVRKENDDNKIPQTDQNDSNFAKENDEVFNKVVDLFDGEILR